MFKKWIEPFRHEVSRESAMNHLRVIANLHRIQASPGYREAANYCLKQLQRAGLQSELVTYPADPDTYFGNYRSFREWRCREGVLHLVEPHHHRLARYTEMELSIIQRSTATPPEGIITELVLVENATEHTGYQDIDVKGKIVLARGDQMRITELAIETYGAVGIVLDNMSAQPPLRTREDLYDATQYTSFWWHDEEVTGFGFALSPRMGDQLRALCRKGPVKVHARVDAELIQGVMENVEAFIPGETDEEVLLISHLCHPKPGGNDNASGPATLLETARTLNRLITDGMIPKPRRGIRFLMMPEFTGTHAYIHMHPDRLPKTVAALNLDMVGADQSKSGGPLTVVRTSRAIASYTAELAYAILDEVAQDCKTFDGTSGYSLINRAYTPFSSGSDHYIVSDPSVGVPCPMMITWPDKFYHTSADTPDNIDPKMLERVAVTAATYLYWIANSSVKEIGLLAGKLATQFSKEIDEVFGNLLDGLVTPSLIEARIHFLKDRKLADLRSLERLVPDDQLTTWQPLLSRQITFVEHTYTYALGMLQSLLPFTTTTAQAEAAATAVVVDREQDPLLQKVYVRKHVGPVHLSGFLRHLDKEEQERWHDIDKNTLYAYSLQTYLQYWMDGKHTLADVIRLVELESGLKDVSFTLHYVRLLLRLGLLVEVTHRIHKTKNTSHQYHVSKS